MDTFTVNHTYKFLNPTTRSLLIYTVIKTTPTRISYRIVNPHTTNIHGSFAELSLFASLSELFATRPFTATQFAETYPEFLI